MSDTAATHVVVSFPDELSAWGRDQIDRDRYKNYLRKTVGDIEEGMVWEEFADVGCCGDSLDIKLRIESFEGAPRMGPETDIEFVERVEAMEGGWRVQSAAGPGATTGKE